MVSLFTFWSLIHFSDIEELPDVVVTLLRYSPFMQFGTIFQMLNYRLSYYILERFFAKTREEATRIMMHVHRRGVGICGVYTYEVAETKVTQVMDFARQNQHPLQCTLEKD